jgi:hypothetical protein
MEPYTLSLLRPVIKKPQVTPMRGSCPRDIRKRSNGEDDDHLFASSYGRCWMAVTG